MQRVVGHRERELPEEELLFAQLRRGWAAAKVESCQVVAGVVWDPVPVVADVDPQPGRSQHRVWRPVTYTVEPGSPLTEGIHRIGWSTDGNGWTAVGTVVVAVGIDLPAQKPAAPKVTGTPPPELDPARTVSLPSLPARSVARTLRRMAREAIAVQERDLWLTEPVRATTATAAASGAGRTTTLLDRDDLDQVVAEHIWRGVEKFAGPDRPRTTWPHWLISNVRREPLREARRHLPGSAAAREVRALIAAHGGLDSDTAPTVDEALALLTRHGHRVKRATVETALHGLPRIETAEDRWDTITHATDAGHDAVHARTDAALVVRTVADQAVSLDGLLSAAHPTREDLVRAWLHRKAGDDDALDRHTASLVRYRILRSYLAPDEQANGPDRPGIYVADSELAARFRAHVDQLLNPPAQ